MYYAYGMSKKSLTKKRVIIIGSIIVALIIVAGGYYYLSDRPQKNVAPSEASQKEAKKLSLAGDQTLSAQYIEQINAKNTTAAQKLFTTAIAQAPDDATKQQLLSQNITLALSYSQTRAAEQAALDAIKVRPSYAAYNDAYRVYVVMRDYPKQRQMLEGAIAAAKTEDREDKEQLVSALEMQLESVDAMIARDNR